MGKKKRKKTASGRKQSVPILDKAELAFTQACAVMKAANTIDGAVHKNSLKEVVERFNTDRQNFICTEVLKIFCQTKDEDIALRALELLTEAARPF